MLSFVLLGGGVRAGRPLLRRADRDDPHLGQRLHLRLRHARRVRGLDHRLGPDPRVRGRQRRGGHRLVGLLRIVPARPSASSSRSGSGTATATSPSPTPSGWPSCPLVFGHRVAINLPGIVIVALITWVLVIGIKESARVNNAMVVLKLAVLALFVGVGVFYVDPANWTPFAPNGWTRHPPRAPPSCSSPTSASTRSPPRPRRPRTRSATCRVGILGSLAVCTVIYVIVGLVATGLVPYQQLKGSDPAGAAPSRSRASPGARPSSPWAP